MIKMFSERDENVEDEYALPLWRPNQKRKPAHFYRPAELREKRRPLRIQEGNGIKLGDIKKVSSNLRKREIDADLRYFHVILYGVMVKNKDLKRNILRFSGFLWGPPHEEERKEQKLRRKIAKYKKYQLLDICSMLEIKNVTSEDKKTIILDKLITFLKCPHDFRNASLEEEEEVTNLKRTKAAGQSLSDEASSEGDEEEKSKSLEAKDSSDDDDSNGDNDETEDVGDDCADNTESASAEPNCSSNGSDADDGGDEGPAETTNDSDRGSVTEMAELPDMDENAILVMMDSHVAMIFLLSILWMRIRSQHQI